MRSCLRCLILYCFIFMLAAAFFSGEIYDTAAVLQLSNYDLENNTFRRQQLSENHLKKMTTLTEQLDMAPSDLFTVSSAYGNGKGLVFPTGWSAAHWQKAVSLLMKKGRNAYKRVSSAYGAIWDDVRCFPVTDPGVSYENSWMFERNYGGLRGHEGTDLMPSENVSGYYPVLSMTDGIVEKVGWLEKGGWRIGIRSPSGGYFYYAHLSSYSQQWQIGQEVQAGTELGKMGDTGYGPEGTCGKFDVHLHLGIYIQTEQTEELSVNPYWVLRYTQS